MGEIARLFGLTDNQSQAVELRGQDLALTAGAGSGKTLTLVARYLSLLVEGLVPPRVVAITFTEKAAREMRNRVRSKLNELARLADQGSDRSLWEGLDAQMDSARIGTIHSLCAELLRAYPAEMGIDPQFEVLDEGQAAALQLQVVQDSLAWAVDQPALGILFSSLTVRGLEALLAYLLARRLDTKEVLVSEPGTAQLIGDVLRGVLANPELADPLKEIRTMLSKELQAEAGATLAEQLVDCMAILTEAEKSLDSGDWLACAQNLYQARREKMNLQAGKRGSRAKEMLSELREAYDKWLDPWLGGSKSADSAPNLALELVYARTIPAVRNLFLYALDRYQEGLRQRRALDFDDLEAGAVALLKIDSVRTAWWAEIDAVLVDEFQDTNNRQREIVTRLASLPGQPGRLFVVGDARQSIYRFRGADVRVFRGLQKEIEQAGGQVINLDLTFRAHAGLLAITEELLAKIMGTQAVPEKPYKIPFSSLLASRQVPAQRNEEPYLEFILGLGEDAGQSRQAAAQALADRLWVLKQEKQIESWQEVCLLFRASTAFPVYEQAFENSGIPFVTVAGRGFYDRPEIRDLLNMLQALADPWDDLALAGLLRSPAFGLSDAALYRLRWSGDQPRSLWLALERDREMLDPEQRALAMRALTLMAELRQQVDRLPVAEVLKQLIDATDYRAILAASESKSKGSSRLWRNLDKLLDDAMTSRLVNLRAFLEYLATLKDAGAREGEAPVEAESALGGAVRLMTVHKAKGLEFGLVVIADAGRAPRTSAEPAYLMAETGLAARLDNLEGESLVYRMARWLDKQQSEAEEQRLLYVAATRARERLIVSGHLTAGRQRPRASGWLGELLGAAGFDAQFLEPAATGNMASTSEGRKYRIQVFQGMAEPGRGFLGFQPAGRLVSQLPALYQPIPKPAGDEPAIDVRVGEPVQTSWNTVNDRLTSAAELTGKMVHRALQRWLFPDDPALKSLLETLAVENGLTGARQQADCFKKAGSLLNRLRLSPLYDEVLAAQERYHELPFTRPVLGRGSEVGFIDLLYRNQEGWHLIDFKTDELLGVQDLQEASLKHRKQLQRYMQAVQTLLGPLASARLCFLDALGQVKLVDVL